MPAEQAGSDLTAAGLLGLLLSSLFVCLHTSVGNHAGVVWLLTYS
jgi:hypothetical protein